MDTVLSDGDIDGALDVLAHAEDTKLVGREFTTKMIEAILEIAG